MSALERIYVGGLPYDLEIRRAHPWEIEHMSEGDTVVADLLRSGNQLVFRAWIWEQEGKHRVRRMLHSGHAGSTFRNRETMMQVIRAHRATREATS